MLHPKEIPIREYQYQLPESRIAMHPLPDRDESKLLVFREGRITESVFAQLPGELPAGSLMVFNNSQVIEARILFQKPSGATIEVFCLEPGPGSGGGVEAALQATGTATWRCLVGNASAWNRDLILEKSVGNEGRLQARVCGREADQFLVEFCWQPAQRSFAEIMHLAGSIPLPPYIRRKAEATDAERYQTLYAERPGSVAAPTAGLHFTARVIDGLVARGIDQDVVTLHVGAGTFKPVKAALIGGHDMHAEWIEVKRSLLENLAAHAGKGITAVGTTSLRTLESLYWIGTKLLKQNPGSADHLQLGQWEPYEADSGVSVTESMQAIIAWLIKNQRDALTAHTSLMIAPGYRFRVVDRLVTNFHQPGSTLLLLIAAFIGEEWKSVYAYALENGFRFLSYGDSCLLVRPPLSS